MNERETILDILDDKLAQVSSNQSAFEEKLKTTSMDEQIEEYLVTKMSKAELRAKYNDRITELKRCIEWVEAVR